MLLQVNTAQPYVPGRASRKRGIQASPISITSTVFPGQLELIMTIGVLPDAVEPDAVEPGIHCVRTHWIQGFIAFHRSGTRGL